ncbi:hypothetical protein SAMN05421867_11826 [Cellulomonas marina]|uniref:Uncharacterized protein n=1 Tax=Cellulomonas marina TaxID=988821 RepID=A0A1I1AL56_9CELL|nr:hypothetical protein SAMN05421867_11826 [Cellulomonas marina]
MKNRLRALLVLLVSTGLVATAATAAEAGIRFAP